MPVDAKKLEAWLNEAKKPDADEDDPVLKLRGEGAEEEEDASEDTADDESESEEEKEAEGDLEDEFPTLFQALEESAPALEEALDLLDPEMLEDEEAEWPEEERELLSDALSGLPEELTSAIAEEAYGIEWAKAQEIGHALEAGGHTSFPARVGGFLFHAAEFLSDAETGDEEDVE